MVLQYKSSGDVMHLVTLTHRIIPTLSEYSDSAAQNCFKVKLRKQNVELIWKSVGKITGMVRITIFYVYAVV